MSRIKFIEMPREEIRLDALEQSMIGAGGDCRKFVVCVEEKNTSDCQEHVSGLCSGSCTAELYCKSLTCEGKYVF